MSAELFEPFSQVAPDYFQADRSQNTANRLAGVREPRDREAEAAAVHSPAVASRRDIINISLRIVTDEVAG